MLTQRVLRAIFYLTVSLFLFLGDKGCNSGDEKIQVEFLYPQIDSVSFSGCLNTASPVNTHTLTLTSDGEGYLNFWDFNSELCCETDSILVWLNYSNDSCFIHIVDMGPYSWCFCPNRISFRAGPFEGNNVVFQVLESQSAFKRDTFLFTINPESFTDTILSPCNSQTALSPLFLSTVPGGCNAADSADAVNLDLSMSDTTWVEYRNDSVIVTTALNYGCCAPFTTSYYDRGDTIFFYVEDVCNYPDEDCYCDCSCCYLFSFIMKKREEALFPYKILLINAFNDNPVTLWWGAIDTRVFD